MFVFMFFVFFFKQKTAYEMRISDWSSDVCSSDLQKRYEAAPEGHEAKDGDQVVMDFVGKVDGEAFEGGTGEGMAVVIGSGNLIPGFEDQLVGVKAGKEKTIEVTFPEDYNAENLKGKAATFDLKITEVKVSAEIGTADEFAK